MSYINNFKTELLKHSVNKDYYNAIAEWKLQSVYIDYQDNKSCVCGKEGIVNICVMKNIYNEHIIEVGNKCVKKFLSENIDDYFISIKNIKKEPSNSISYKLLIYCFNKNILNEWDVNFYKSMLGKKKYTKKQIYYKRKINYKILNYFINIQSKNYLKNKGVDR